jgi:hypothetical protein
LDKDAPTASCSGLSEVPRGLSEAGPAQLADTTAALPGRELPAQDSPAEHPARLCGVGLTGPESTLLHLSNRARVLLRLAI